MRDPDVRVVNDLRKIMTESRRFSSVAEPGLELVDVLTNATRRALMGYLGPGGWRNIPLLMIHLSDRQYVQLIAIGTADPSGTPMPYASVLRHFRNGGKDMIAPRFRR